MIAPMAPKTQKTPKAPMPSIKSNLHTHTTLCDGRATVDEMAQAAVRLGFTALGFSGHATSAIGASCCIKDMAAYRSAVAEAKAKYLGALDIYCGIENELLEPYDAAPFDYSIGSVHHVLGADGVFHVIDFTPGLALAGIREGFGGDGLAFARAYYGSIAKICSNPAPTPPADILGHFDIIRKFNGDGALFDDTAKSYRSAALAALEQVCACGMLLEVNTAPVAQGLSDEPYPARFILERALELGMRVAVGSDAHAPERLDAHFAQTAQLLADIGFTETWELTPSGFAPRPLTDKMPYPGSS